MSDELDLSGLDAEPDRERSVPVPVDLIGEPWESQWTEAVRQLQAQGSWRATDAPMLEAMIDARRQAAELRPLARGEPVVVGSTGQAIANPLFAHIRGYEALAAKLARELKLSAGARDGGTSDAQEDTGPKDELEALEAGIADELEERRSSKRKSA